MAERSVVVKLRAEVENFRKGMTEAADAADKAAKKWDATEAAGRKLATVGGLILAGVGLAVKAYADFDKQMSRVQAATHASVGDMKMLREAAVEAGADTAFSAKEAAQGVEELAKAGVSTRDILTGGLTGALSLAAAGEMGVGDAAELAATALTQFKLEGRQIPHVADLLAAGAGKAQGSVADLGTALKQGGLVASQYGLSIEETVGGLAAFASAGLIGSDAGTSFKTMLQRLTPTSKEAEAKMRELGFSAFDANGNFKGLAAVADNLQQSMKDLTPEQRNAAMAVIFGSDAVRAASVLYEQGAAGIQDWIDQVNDAGYAALTAAMNQDNLAGDIEKLGGSIDSVFLKSGKGANDVLRGLAQGAESLVDAVGRIPAPMLQAGLTTAATAGALALVAGGVMMTLPKIAEARTAWASFEQSNGRLAGALGKTAKAAGLVFAAFTALQVIGAVSKAMSDGEKSASDYAQAFLTIGSSSKDLDAVVENTSALGTQIHGVGDALVRVGSFDWYDSLNNFLGDMVGGTSRTQQFRDSVKQVDQTLTQLAGSGSLPKAAQAFNAIAAEADRSAKAQGRSGMAAAEVLKLMPAYTAAIRQQATELGYKIQSDEELVQIAQGRIPPAMEAAAAAMGKTGELQKIQKGISEEQAKALGDVGISADGTILSLEKYTSALIAAGLIQLNANEAERQFAEKLQAVDEALQQNGSSLDINTQAGRGNQRAIDAVAESGLRMMEAMARNGASQDVLQGKLRGTYDSLVAAYGKFGITGQAADELARKALGIPPKVNIDSWMADNAKRMADQTTGALNSIPKSITVTVYAQADIASAQAAGDALRANSMIVANRYSSGAAYRQAGGTIPEYHSLGGRIGTQYLSSGGRTRLVEFRPNGTDTTPVMATPGEFMLKRSSSQSLGYENLAIANATGRWPGGRGGQIDASTHFNAPVYTVDLDALNRKNETARRDALATIGVY